MQHQAGTRSFLPRKHPGLGMLISGERLAKHRFAEKTPSAHTAKSQQIECEDKPVVAALPFVSGAHSPAAADVPDPVSLREHQSSVQGVIMEGV